MSGDGTDTEIFDRIGDLERNQDRHDERIANGVERMDKVEEVLKEISGELKKIQRTIWQFSGVVAFVIVLADFIFHK